MNEDLYANVTVNDHYPLYSSVNTTSAEDIFDEHGDQGDGCAKYYKIPPRSFYLNNSQETYPFDSIDMNYVTVIKLCVLIIIIIAGLIGNISAILTIALNRSMRKTVHFYFANLAVADFMTCIFAVPAFYRMFLRHYDLGGFICKTSNFALSTCLVCSVLTLSAISCDRFMSVCFPLRVRVTKQRKSLVVTFIWFLSMVVSIPYILSSKMYVIEWNDFEQNRCISDWSNEHYYHESLGSCVVKSPLLIFHSLLVTVFIYFLPILIMITAYSFILWKLARITKHLEEHTPFYNIYSSANKRMHKMVFTVLLVFVICWTPYHCGILFDLTHSKSSDFPIWWETYAWVAWNIELCNSFMNPVIYAGMEMEFRQGMLAVLRCRKPVITPKPSQNMHDAPCTTKTHESHETRLDSEM